MTEVKFAWWVGMAMMTGKCQHVMASNGTSSFLDHKEFEGPRSWAGGSLRLPICILHRLGMAAPSGSPAILCSDLS